VRRRYLAVRVQSEKPVGSKEVLDAIWTALTQLFGEYGASQSELTLIRNSKQKSYFILRCSHKALPMVRASIASITEINDKQATAHIIRVSGTLKALRKNNKA